MTGLSSLEIIPIQGLPEVEAGMDLARILAQALRRQGLQLVTGDILVVTQKIVSKAEGRVVDLASVEPSPFARALAELQSKDPRVVELVLREAARVVRMVRGLMLMETRHGFVCANAGVDLSNVAAGQAVLLPLDPDASAARIRAGLAAEFGTAPAVVISDTFGRPWRLGQTNVAIGVAGMRPLMDYRGSQDDFGNELHVTQIAVADELAAAAELVMGKSARCPAALIRGFRYEPADGSARELIRPPELDLFR